MSTVSIAATTTTLVDSGSMTPDPSEDPRSPTEMHDAFDYIDPRSFAWPICDLGDVHNARFTLALSATTLRPPGLPTGLPTGLAMFVVKIQTRAGTEGPWRDVALLTPQDPTRTVTCERYVRARSRHYYATAAFTVVASYLAVPSNLVVSA